MLKLQRKRKKSYFDDKTKLIHFLEEIFGVFYFAPLFYVFFV